MTVYSRLRQQHPYDAWETKYLLCTSCVSFLGIALGLAGKSKPRLIGLFISIFSLLVALADGVSV
jgi:hypothetical protein